MTLELVRGQRYRAVGAHKDATTGAPVNITGWQIIFTARIKRFLITATPSITKECTVLDGVAGTYELLLTTAETLLIEPHKYECEVWRANDENETPMGDGTLNVKRGLLFQ